MLEAQIFEEKGRVIFDMRTSPLAGDMCLHNDKISKTWLDREEDKSVIGHDFYIMNNLAALESTLTVSTFNPQGIEGVWSISNDDLYISEAYYKDFFRIESMLDTKKVSTKVVYKIMNYDYLGPADFHEDRALDPTFNTNVDGPYLQLNITFTSTAEQNLEVIMIYPLNKKHITVDKQHRSFNMKPKVSVVQFQGGQVEQSCDNLELFFKVKNTYVAFDLKDPADECIPYQVKGEWRLHYSDEEALESSIEDALRDQLNPENFVEKLAHETREDDFIEELENSEMYTEEEKREIE